MARKPDTRTYAERKVRRPIATCEACSKEYRQQRRTQRWCSQTCAGPNKPGSGPRGGLSPEARERQRLYWQEKNRRRRAVKRGGASEPYTLAEIAARDRERCGLCGGRVAMRQVAPHPKAPTIDHVLPVSEGGDDTRANVQLAHFRCNSAKGARGSQQLALIG
jgi:5-methylcytosine-specific restriction endonuclease McrA